MNLIDTSPGRSVLHIGWNTARKRHIKKHPYCAACGFKPKFRNNDVHHIIPRHIAPHLATESSNLITLCRKYKCHLRVGHFGNYRKFWNDYVSDHLYADLDIFIGDDMRWTETWFKEHFDEQLEKWKQIDSGLSHD